jgi:hypothetical protein
MRADPLMLLPSKIVGQVGNDDLRPRRRPGQGQVGLNAESFRKNRNRVGKAGSERRLRSLIRFRLEFVDPFERGPSYFYPGNDAVDRLPFHDSLTYYQFPAIPAKAPMTVRVVHAERFYHEGRGPTLVAVHLAERSAHLKAVDFLLPDAESADQIHHLQFVKSQSFMFTPEEVENYAVSGVKWDETSRGALVSLGQSAWMTTFSQRHLGRCEHYRAMFYDEFLDVLCEHVLVERGPYK